MTIQPINIWKDGSQLTATEFILTSIFDDLENEARFHYSLQTTEGYDIANGNLDMRDDYENWDGTNAWAYSWAMEKLGLQ